MGCDLSAENFAALHKRAFRTAFDFLNAHFPPENSAEWWDATMRDVMKSRADDKENWLQNELLAGVWEYLYRENQRRKEAGVHEPVAG